MTLINRFGMFAATVLVASSPLISDPSAIGRASAENGLVVDNGRASGNVMVFEGSTIQTATRSQIRLSNGTHLDLAAGSKAQVFTGHLALNTGASEVQSGSGFEIDARTLRIKPADAKSIAKVDLSTGNQVVVTAINSPVDVRNQGGVLVARVLPSRPMSFVPQETSGSRPSTFNNTGCLLDAGDSVIMTDASGRQVFELRGKKGAAFKSHVGKRTNVVGVVDTSATPKPGATKAANGGSVQVITVAGMKADKDQANAHCDTIAKNLAGTSIIAGAGASAAAGAATAGSVAAATGAATAAGIAVPAAGVSTAAVAAVGAIAAGAGIGGAAGAGAIGGGTVSP